MLEEEDYLATKKKNPHKTVSKRTLCGKERKAHLMET